MPTIEAVWWCHFRPYIEDFDGIVAAVAMLEDGEAYGTLSSVGVFVDGQPALTDVYVTKGGREPTDDEAEQMREDYAQAKGRR